MEQRQVLFLIDRAENVRNKDIIALFVESGLRLSELVDIKLHNIDWTKCFVRVVGKGRKGAYAPFGQLTKKYLTE